MTTKKNAIFIGLIVIAWIIFVGLCIEAGGLIVNFVYSIFKPEVISKLYQKLDLSEIYNRSAVAFYSIYSLLLVIAILKAYLFYIVIKMVSKMELDNPFSSFVADKITQISYFTLSIGVLSYIARQTTKKLYVNGYDVESLNQFWGDSQAYILMAAIIYVIATIFQKGVELQKENDLTV